MPHFTQNNVPPVTGAVRSGNDSFVALMLVPPAKVATYTVIQGDQVTNWVTYANSLNNLVEFWLVGGVPTPLAINALHAYKAGKAPVGDILRLR